MTLDQLVELGWQSPFPATEMWMAPLKTRHLAMMGRRGVSTTEVSREWLRDELKKLSMPYVFFFKGGLEGWNAIERILENRPPTGTWTCFDMVARKHDLTEDTKFSCSYPSITDARAAKAFCLALESERDAIYVSMSESEEFLVIKPPEKLTRLTMIRKLHWNILASYPMLVVAPGLDHNTLFHILGQKAPIHTADPDEVLKKVLQTGDILLADMDRLSENEELDFIRQIVSLPGQRTVIFPTKFFPVRAGKEINDPLVADGKSIRERIGAADVLVI